MVKSTANDLLERENQAGNAEDSLSAGQKKYDSQFNRHTNSQELDDEQIDTHGDKIQSNYNADEPDADIKNTKDQEESGGQNSLNYKKGESAQPAGRLAKLKKGFKKIGPSTGITGFVLAAFGGMTILLSPAALLVAIEKAVTNDGSDSARTNGVMRRAYMGNILSTSKNDTPCAGSKIKCKFKTMGQRQLDKFKNMGFEVDTVKDEKTGRSKVKSIKYPDGKVADNGKVFNAHADFNIEGRRTAGHVFNVRSKFFQDAKFNSVLDKFKLKKSNVLKSSNDKDKEKRKAAIDKSFNENIDVGEDKKGGIKRVQAALEKAKKTPGLKRTLKGGGIVSAMIAVGCTSYNTIRVTTAIVKAEWIYQLVKFAYPFVQAASQIQDQGNIEPEVVENLGDRLTWYDNKKEVDGKPNPKYNLGATDSQGLKAALYGDFQGLEDFTKQYTTGKTAYAVAGSQLVNTIQDTLGKGNIRDICIGNSYIGMASSAQCLAGPWAAAFCAAIIGAVVLFGDEAIDLVINQLSQPALDMIEDANLTSDLKGVDAGNALAAGIGLMLSNSTLGSGGKPVSSGDKGVNQVKKFITATDPEYNRQVELAKYEAKDTPFDIYNQYSFAGTIATSLNPYNAQTRSVFEHAANALAVLATPLSFTTNTANALFSQPSQMTANPGAAEGRMKNCGDPDMESIGAGCDWSGRMIGYSTDNFLSMADRQASGEEDVIDTVVQELIGSNDIDESGKPRGLDSEKTEEMSEYTKYRKYCTDHRTDPLGTSSKPIEDGKESDQYWYDGSKCLEDNKNMDNYAFYFNWCERQFPAAEETTSTDCWSDTAAPAGPATKNTGDWVIPTQATCSQPWKGSGHQGIDMAAPEGTPIVAPTSMKIIFAGMGENGNGNSGYGNVVVATATDGSGKDFRFGHMVTTPSVTTGQEVSKGQEIGKVGNTGNSFGNHLHFEIYPAGKAVTVSGSDDPIPVLKEHGVEYSCPSS